MDPALAKVVLGDDSLTNSSPGARSGSSPTPPAPRGRGDRAFRPGASVLSNPSGGYG